MFEIGLITTTHGIKGELKVKDLSDFNRFKKGEVFFLIDKNERITLTVEQVRSHKGALIIKFREFNNINDVEKYKDYVIYSDKRGKLSKDEYYFQDLINLKVYTDDNEFVGTVTEVLEYPSSHVLEISNGDKKYLVPFIKQFIKSVDNEKIIITPIEGLISWW